MARKSGNEEERFIENASTRHEAATSSEGKPVRLKPKISLLNGCSLIIGVIIGSGIFISPRGVLYHAGSPLISIAIWACCGLYSTLGALCYAELGTTIPRSGGDYVYIAEAFGQLPAFLFLWIALIIVNPTSNAVVALTFSNYLLKPFFHGCDVPNLSVQLLAACLIALLTATNCYNVRWVTRAQDASTLVKMLILAFIVAVGLWHLVVGDGYDAQIKQPPTPMPGNSERLLHPIAEIALGFYAGVYSFSGWNYLNFVTEEIKQPSRYAKATRILRMVIQSPRELSNLPLAIFISLPIVTVVYVLVNISYFIVLTPEEIMESSAVAVTFTSRLFGNVAMYVIPPLVACSSCVGSLNGIIFTFSRMFYAAAREGQLPELLAMINIDQLTPMSTLLLMATMSMLMLFVTDVYVLINYLAFAETAVVTMAVAGLIRLRWTRREMRRPIKFNLLIPITFVLVSLYILLVPFVVRPTEIIVAACIIASGVPIYLVFISFGSKPMSAQKLNESTTRAVQKVLMSVLPTSTEAD